MINVCKPGDRKRHSFRVIEDHFPTFKTGTVHQVCSTYILAREIEWCTRLFVLDMLESHEEGIGTMLSIEHLSPAFEKEEIIIEAEVESMTGNELICTFSAFISTKGHRMVATGKTGQKILGKAKLDELFSSWQKDQ